MLCSDCGNTLASDAMACPQCGCVEARRYYEAIIGRRNKDYYLNHFTAFDAAGRAGLSWNWSAFFLGSAWFSYRKMDIAALPLFILTIAFYVAVIIAVPFDGDSLSISPCVWPVAFGILLFIVVPACANAFYYWHCRRRIKKTRARPPDQSSQFAALADQGGTSIFEFLVAIVFAAFLIAAFTVGALANRGMASRSEMGEALMLADG